MKLKWNYSSNAQQFFASFVPSQSTYVVMFEWIGVGSKFKENIGPTNFIFQSNRLTY